MSDKNKADIKEIDKKDNIVFDKGTIVTILVPVVILFAAMLMVFYIAGVF